MKHQKIPKALGVIFAGGTGTRLWPISTEENPKQINDLFEHSTLLVEAYTRARHLFAKKDIVIVTTSLILDKVKHLIDLPEKNYVIQPENADTAVAFAYTALYLEYYFPQHTAVTLYSDHIISSDAQFIASLKKAIAFAQAHPAVVTIGTKPLYPSTEFGYIQLGTQMSPAIFQVKQFHEKPNESLAKKFLQAGTYVWNTGLYVWQTDVLLQTVKRISPQMYQQLLDLRIHIGNSDFPAKLIAWYAAAKRQSFDVAFSEKMHELYVLVSNYKWLDIGNWKTVYEHAEKDSHDNAILLKDHPVKVLDSSGCLVASSHQNIALVGVHDLLVVESADGLLVCHKSRAADVKKVAQAFAKK